MPNRHRLWGVAYPGGQLSLADAARSAGGYIVDPSGAPVVNARVTVLYADTRATQTTLTDATGRWVMQNVPSGRVRIAATSPGFQAIARDFIYDAGRPTSVSLALNVGATTETMEVRSNASNEGITTHCKRREEETGAAADGCFRQCV